MEKVNELCRKLRKDAGLSVTEVVAMTGLNKAMIYRVEAGTASVSLNFAKGYADLFGKQYESELTKHLVRYNCGQKIGELLKERGLTIKKFANAFGVARGSVQMMISGAVYHSDGNPNRGLSEEEIPVLARYFHVKESELRINKYYMHRVGNGNCKLFTDQVKVVEPAPNAPKPKKTAQMICEEEKKMEYEEAMKKAKEYDILMAKNRALQATAEDLNEQLNSAVEELNRVNKALNELKNSEPEVVTVAPHDYESVKAENAKYKDILFNLLLERYERE